MRTANHRELFDPEIAGVLHFSRGKGGVSPVGMPLRRRVTGCSNGWLKIHLELSATKGRGGGVAERRRHFTSKLERG